MKRNSKHADAAQDRKLIREMMNERGTKRPAKGKRVPKR
jgi:hypothetical protein